MENKFKVGDHIRPLSDGIRHYDVTTGKWRGYVNSIVSIYLIGVTSNGKNNSDENFTVESKYFELDPNFHPKNEILTYTLF